MSIYQISRQVMESYMIILCFLDFSNITSLILLQTPTNCVHRLIIVCYSTTTWMSPGSNNYCSSSETFFFYYKIYISHHFFKAFLTQSVAPASTHSKNKSLKIVFPFYFLFGFASKSTSNSFTARNMRNFLWNWWFISCWI